MFRLRFVLGLICLLFYAHAHTICDIVNDNRCNSDQECINPMENEKYVVIGDIHGSFDGFLEILAKANITTDKTTCKWAPQSVPITMIQVGDLVDRGYQAQEAWDCLRSLQATAPSDAKVIRLIGNHEIWWLEGFFKMINKRADTVPKIKHVIKTMKEDILSDKLVGSHALRINDKEILFTHAGLRSNFIKYMKALETPIETPTDIAAFINGNIKDIVEECGNEFCEFEHEIFEAGPDRGGRNIGGPFWTDFRVIAENIRNGEMKDIDFIQIVGHSASHCAFDDEEDEDCIRYTPNAEVICVDGGMVYGSRSFLLFEHGHFKTFEKELHGDTWVITDISSKVCATV